MRCSRTQGDGVPAPWQAPASGVRNNRTGWLPASGPRERWLQRRTVQPSHRSPESPAASLQALMPLPVALETTAESPQHATQQAAARVDRMSGPGELCAQIALDLRIGPPGNVVVELMCQRVLQVSE